MSDREINLNISAEDDASRVLDDVADKVDALDDGDATVEVDADVSDAMSAIERFERDVDGLTDDARELRVEFRAQQLQRDIRNALRDLERLEDPVDIAARTTDLENAQRDLRDLAELADRKYEIEIDADPKRSARAAADDLDTMRGRAEGLQSGIGPLRGFTDELGAGAAGVAANAMIDAGEAVEIFGAQLGISDRILSRVSFALGGIGVAVGIATAAWSQYRNVQKQVEEQTEALIDVQRDLADGSIENAVRKLQEQYGDLFDALYDAGFSTAEIFDLLEGRTDGLGAKFENLSFENKAAAQQAQIAWADSEAQLANNERQVDSLTSYLEGTRGKAVEVGGAGVEAFGAIDAAAGDAEDGVDDVAQAYDDLVGKIQNRQAYRDLEDSFDDVEKAAFEAWTAAQSGAEDADEKARNYQSQLDQLTLDTIDYLVEVLKIPPERATEIATNLNLGSVQEAERAIAWLTRQRDVRIRFSVVGAAPGTVGGVPAQAGDDSPFPRVTNNIYVPASDGRALTSELDRWGRVNGP